MPKKYKSLFLAPLAVLTLASCGTELAKHSHVYDLENPTWQWSQFSSATVTLTCKDCDEATEGHTYVIDAVITLADTANATCEAEGHKTYKASATYDGQTLEDTKTLTIPASGHSEDSSVWNHDAEKHWHPCLYCGDAYRYEESVHSMSEWTETVAPTYHAAGSKERHCTVCLYTETEPIDKLTYSYEEVKELADSFLGYASGSAYLGGAMESLLDGIECMNESDKTAHLDEVTKWQEAAQKEKTNYDKFYEVIVDTEGLNNYSDVITDTSTDVTYGKTLKVNGDGALVTGERWSFGPNRKESLLKEGVAAIRFAVYAPQPMDVIFTNDACNAFYNASTSEIVNSNITSKLPGSAWAEFTIPTSVIEEMDSFHIGLYLSPSPYIGYGIPVSSDSGEKGSAYVSEIIGIKDAYYSEEAASLDTAISSMKQKTLTMWNGGKLRKIRSDYESLSTIAKAFVNNLEDLASMETTYAESWTCYNYSWIQGQVNKSTVFEASLGNDETYGAYTQFDSGSDAWILNFTPDSDTAITGAVKMAIYNPTEGNVAGYYVTNDWKNADQPSLLPGWNVIEIPANAFKDSVASGITVGIQIKSITTAGWKFTPLYSEK